MTDLAVVVAPAAERDIAEAFAWYQERNALAANGFRAEVFEAIERIAAAPLGRPANDEGNRSRVVHRFPYTVWYEVVDQTVTVLAVAHHRRRPGYWRPGSQV